MRMRKKKNLDVRLERTKSMLIDNPTQYKGKWREYFKCDLPIAIEVGCGKGRFIIEHAKQNPEKIFIGIEREIGALLTALENSIDLKLPNLIFIACDGAVLTDIFEKGEVNQIFLNFSDPWPPKKQAKRRLTHKNFLTLYREILSENGQIEFKTDNQKLFEFSLNEMSGFGMTLSEITFDLHSTDTPNIMTEYEEKFSSQGMPIYRVVGKFNKI